jgi:hypothetical protein
MPGRVCEDAPTPRIGVQKRTARIEHRLLGYIEVCDVDVQVELLGVFRLRPSRRSVVGDLLERQDQPGVGVQGGELLAHGPPPVRAVHLTAEQFAIELRQIDGVRAVQDNALYIADQRFTFHRASQAADRNAGYFQASIRF